MFNPGKNNDYRFQTAAIWQRCQEFPNCRDVHDPAYSCTEYKLWATSKTDHRRCRKGSVMPERVHATPHHLVHPARIPPAISLLTVLGFIPFMALAIAAIILGPEHRPFALFAQHGYGAVILSFLGGVYWGWEICTTYLNSRPISVVRLGIGVLPPIIGWISLLLPAVYTAAALSLSFGLCLGYDLWRTDRHLAPRWYPALRIPVTVAVVTALLAPVILI